MTEDQRVKMAVIDAEFAKAVEEKSQLCLSKSIILAEQADVDKLNEELRIKV